MTQQLTVDELIVKLQNQSALGKGKYRVVAEHADGKPHYFAKDQSLDIHEGKQIIELYPEGGSAHHHF